MKALHYTALVLVIVGALNWGLVGLFQFDLAAALFGGQAAAFSRIVYSLVGLSGLIVAATSLALYGSVRTTTILDRMGRSEGAKRGPEPGEGAVIHHSSGNADFDGLSGDVLPPRKSVEQDQPYPPKRAAD